MELFTARARAARPGFELTDEDAWLAAEISRLVDGLPLAIELAAARVNVLGLAELLALVRRRLELLRDRPATDAAAPPSRRSSSGATTSCTRTRRRCSTMSRCTEAVRLSPHSSRQAPSTGSTR